MISFFRTGLGLLVACLALVATARADEPTGPQTVPDVVGLAQADAERYLKQAGFEIALEVVAAEGTADGRVVSQDPGGLAVRDRGLVVRVRVAGTPKAPEPTPAPRATPPAQPTAPMPPPVEPPPSLPPAVEPPPSLPPSGELPEVPPAGPPAEVPSVPAPAAEPPAPVDVTPPAPAAPAAPGLADLPSESGLDTQGPALPNTFGKSRQEAEQLLAGYELLMEVTLTSPDMQGRVVEQHPEPGQTLAKGQPVTLIFGLANEPGPEYRQVPALEGATAEEAVERLKRAGGYVPVFCTVPSRDDQIGRVVDHTPHRFSFLLKGESVRVRLGRGSGAALPPPLTEPVPGVPPAPSTDVPPSGPLPAPSEPTPAPAEPPPSEPVAPPAPSEPVAPPAPSEPPAGPLPAPTEPAPTEPAPAEPAPAEPAPTEPAPMPFPTQPPRPAPGETRLLGPSEGDSFPKAYGPTFEWQTVPNADGYEWELESEEGQDVWRAVRTEKLIGTKYRPAGMAAARYRWRVRALSGDVVGPWSAWRRLYLY